MAKLERSMGKAHVRQVRSMQLWREGLLCSAARTVPLQPTLLLMTSAKASAVAVAVSALHRADWIALAAAVALPASRAVVARVAALAAGLLAFTLASCRHLWMATDCAAAVVNCTVPPAYPVLFRLVSASAPAG